MGETYILQFHVWMKTTGINGSPKQLLAPIQSSYWANFVFMSAMYLFLSIRCFHLTVSLRDAFIPESNRAIGINCAGVALVAAILWSLRQSFDSWMLVRRCCKALGRAIQGGSTSIAH